MLHNLVKAVNTILLIVHAKDLSTNKTACFKYVYLEGIIGREKNI